MIGIVAPYGRTETTAAALRLADLFEAKGLSVRYVAAGPREHNVHPAWDSRIGSAKTFKVYNALRGCSTVVHFVCDARILKDAKLVAGGQHILVVPWHSLSPATMLLSEYDSLVCPSQACFKDLKSNMDEAKLSVCHWSAGLPIVTRADVGPHPSMCVYCDHTVIDYCAPLLIAALTVLRRELRSPRITLLSTKSWSKKDRCVLKDLVACSEGRITSRPVGNLAEQASLFASHDWVLLPGVRANFGIMADRALACGAPVIAYDVPPINEIVFAERGGASIPCDLYALWNQAPVAIPDLAKLISVCRAALAGTPSVLTQMRRQDWCCAKINKTFDSFWMKLIG